MKKEILKFLVLAMLAVGAGPVSAAVWQWSRTASSNATADSTINWAEGMSPSSVNDSARAMMARLADYRDDISGSIYTAGTSTAYTLTSHQTFDTLAHMDGAAVAFTVHATNGASPTLSVDGLAAKPLNSASGAVIAAGTLVVNTPYVATYVNASSEFRLQGFYGNPYSIPLGGLLAYTGTTAPNSNFILPAGQCISTTTYATYWALMGSPAPGACPAGQFVVVDLRGRTLSALDNLNGTLASRMTAAGCGTALTSVGTTCTTTETFTIGTTNLPAYTPSGTITNGAISTTGTVNGSAAQAGSSISSLTAGGVSAPVTGGALVLASSQAGSTFTGTAQGGASTAIPRVQPTMGVTYLLRVI